MVKIDAGRSYGYRINPQKRKGFVLSRFEGRSPALSFATGREYVHHEFENPQRQRSMNLSLIPTDLQPIAEKVESRQRISEAEALQLYRSNDLNALGIMASAVREQKNGNVATYILNRYINYSNLCILSCQFCAFAAKKRDAHAFERSIDDIVAAVAGIAGRRDHRGPHGRRACIRR